MLLPKLDSLGVRPLEVEEASALYAVIEANRTHCAPENHRSRAIPERLGCNEEARLRETDLIDGCYLDSVVYGLLEEEWGN